MEIAGDPSIELIALTVVGSYLSAGGAGAVNHYDDRAIDAYGQPCGADEARFTTRGAHRRNRPRGVVVPHGARDMWITARTIVSVA